MKLSLIFAIIAVAAFIFSRFARHKAKSILVTKDIEVEEERVEELGLFEGQEVYLSIADTKDEHHSVTISADDKSGNQCIIGSFSAEHIYKLLIKKPVRAYIYAINYTMVTVEIKFAEAL